MRECWFCGEETPRSWHDHVLGLHKDADTTMTPFVIVLRSTWQMETLHYWRSPPNPHHPPPANRPRRLIGGSFELLGAACGLAVPVAYFTGYEELAGVLIAATAGLLFMASKVKPED
ncbi:hypothetical protein ACFU5D_26115 [Streptomyces anthocyanicus]|uniref:hypothetical protein n=1 Tax=Streptomyces anthocyanicus TaxID=68174 RepID=UPI0036C95957